MNIRVRALPRIPSDLTGSNGITVTRANGIFDIALDDETLQEFSDVSELIKIAAEEARDETLALRDDVLGLVTGFTSLIKTRNLITTTTIDAATVTGILTLGYATAGDKGAALYKQVATEPTHAGKVQSLNGIWFELMSLVTNPFMFGAVGDGTTNDGVALNNFFAHAAVVRVSAHCTGNFGTSVPILLGPATSSPSGVTREFQGQMIVTALSPMEKLFTVRYTQNICWDGQLQLIGIGSQPFAGRTVGTGLFLIEAGRFKLTALYALNFNYGGLVWDHNTNSSGSWFGHCRFFDCGSGTSSGANSLEGTWSSPVNNGSTSSVSQTTTINVSTNLPANMETYGTAGDMPIAIWDTYFDRPYHIKSWNRGAGTIEVYPWIDATLTPGTFRYVFGGGALLRGGDANVNTFGTIDAFRCGHGYADGALYGSFIGTLVTQDCFAGYGKGRTTSGAAIGGSIGNYYSESNRFDVLSYTRFTQTWFDIGSSNELDLTKVISIGAPRRSSDNLVTESLEGLNGGAIFYRGRYLQYEKPSRNAGTAVNLVVRVDRPHRTQVYRANSWTLTLERFVPKYNELWGYDSLSVIVIGTGLNGAPTGTLTVNPDTIAVTISQAAPGVFTSAAHGLVADQLIWLATTGALPDPLVINTAYYVKTVLGVDTFTIAATVGGAAIDTTTAGSGTHTLKSESVNSTYTAALSGFNGPAHLLFSYDRATRNWRLEVLGRDANVGTTTVATDVAYSLTPGTSTVHQRHTGTLTADRAVTLTTTGASAGLTRYRITRTGSGAFNLNIGTGPLKALVQNTWCEVVYDGSAFYLEAYGAL